ncbi:MAG: 2-hydroxyacyl-CoA dehydratase [Niameybacter sp.]
MPKLFTKAMKKDYTIIAPTMLPIHFGMIKKVLASYGYHLEFYEGDTGAMIHEGLKNVHNDLCYPAILVIGQLMAALKSGKYDPHKTALMITQTGGGCRASNYIHLLRKALKKSGYEDVPVISVNMSRLERHPGFKLTPVLIGKCVLAMWYGDLIMWISNQCKPYETVKGTTQAVIDRWVNELAELSGTPKFLKTTQVARQILKEFDAIPKKMVQRVKVGIVGEIYVKYAPMGNNHLEDFLIQEDAEVVMAGLSDFMMYSFSNKKIDHDLYGHKGFSIIATQIGYKFLHHMQKKMIHCIERYSPFRPPTDFEKVKEMASSFMGIGIKMGEGWLLTAEMLELIESGVENVICAQPFGCLPNHIVGKGMMRKLKETYPESNIVAIDYDPSSAKVNQENRIKLMLANGLENIHLKNA